MKAEIHSNMLNSKVMACVKSAGGGICHIMWQALAKIRNFMFLTPCEELGNCITKCAN